MKAPEPSFSVNVDMTNPGQFFACCGLLELAHRLWPGAEGWFGSSDGRFNVRAPTDGSCTLRSIVEELLRVRVEGELSAEERTELNNLESRKKALKKKGGTLPKSDEGRRVSLGKQRREGALIFRDPFCLRVAWWQEDSDDIPKTFAGKQEVLRMAQAMLSQLSEALQDNRPFDYRCLLQAVAEPEADGGKREGNRNSKVEPFYFDARRFAHKLDVGFSLDVQEKAIRASAAPLTELLALIGLQRFRPRQTREDKWVFDYFMWFCPLDVVTSAAVACGAVPMVGQQEYRFRLRFRDGQKRYKAFGHSVKIGGTPL